MNPLMHMGGETAYSLTHAVLVYCDAAHGAYATIHDPVEGPKGQVQLGPGRGISSTFVRTLAAELGNRMPIEVLPERVLARTPEVLVWWRPRGVAPLFFQTEKKKALAPLNNLSGTVVPHPALVFRASGQHLWVRALSGNIRPSAETKLFSAPYFNLNAQGSVCTGSMSKPGGHEVSSIDGWEKGFFESHFTHALHGARLTKHPKGFVDLWAGLARRGAKKVFPADTLMPAHQTLLQFATSHVDGGQY